MNNRSLARSRRYLCLALTALTAAALAAPLPAQAWQRSINRSFANGLSASRTITGSRSAGSYERDTTATGPRGNTATRSAAGSWDPQTQTWTRDVTATGAQGQTASRSSTATRTDDGYTRSTTVSGPQGNSATRTAEGHWDPETRTWTRDVAVTGSGQ